MIRSFSVGSNFKGENSKDVLRKVVHMRRRFDLKLRWRNSSIE